MTKKQRKENARIKKELQKEGILPPDKPRLNREKFVREAWKEWADNDDNMIGLTNTYLIWAFAEMLEKRDKNRNVSLEAVGAAKVLRLAAARRKFEEERRERAEEGTYTVGELYEYVKDIYNA